MCRIPKFEVHSHAWRAGYKRATQSHPQCSGVIFYFLFFFLLLLLLLISWWILEVPYDKYWTSNHNFIDACGPSLRLLYSVDYGWFIKILNEKHWDELLTTRHGSKLNDVGGRALGFRWNLETLEANILVGIRHASCVKGVGWSANKECGWVGLGALLVRPPPILHKVKIAVDYISWFALPN